MNHTYILTRQNVLQPLWNVQNISSQQREHLNVSLASSAIEAVSRTRRQITKTSAVSHKEIDTHRVNRGPLRRSWRTDKKNRFLDKVWTPQFSTTPPKPFLLSFSTHLGDQTLARSIWKRSQLPDAFFRLAQGLNELRCIGFGWLRSPISINQESENNTELLPLAPLYHVPCVTLYTLSLSCQTTLTKRQKKKKKKKKKKRLSDVSVHKADPGELIQWVTAHTSHGWAYSAITTKSKIFAPLFLYDPVGWLLQFFMGRKNMY